MNTYPQSQQQRITYSLRTENKYININRLLQQEIITARIIKDPQKNRQRIHLTVQTSQGADKEDQGRKEGEEG